MLPVNSYLNRRVGAFFAENDRNQVLYAGKQRDENNY
jgi:hypothetical protein